MTEETKQKLKYWIVGLFTGCAVATPITAFVSKKIYDGKIEEASSAAFEDGKKAAVAINGQDIVNNAGSAKNGLLGPNKGIPEADIEDSDKRLTEEDYGVPDDEDINNYDTSIDDEEATEEARERTEAHQRYLDMLDKYKGDETLLPRMISADDYANDFYMQKSNVNWYEEDDVFEEDLTVVIDPYMTFGVTSGRELFRNADTRPDPDICYVRNERSTTDFEISRIHGSYAKLVGGEPGLGETDT